MPNKAKITAKASNDVSLSREVKGRIHAAPPANTSSRQRVARAEAASHAFFS
jgi:hypothetical protein